MDFTVDVGEQGGRTIVTAGGELDAHSAPALQQALDPICRAERPALIVDLAGVDFIDSTGLGVLVTALKRVRESEGSLDIVVASPRVLKVFALTGLDVVIPLHETLESALTAS